MIFSKEQAVFILAEATKAEDYKFDSIDMSSLEKDFTQTVMDIVFAESAEIPVDQIRITQDMDGDYCIEASELQAYMESNDIDTEDVAMGEIFNHYSESGIDLNRDNTYIVIESDETYQALLVEAKRGSKSAKNALTGTVDSIKGLTKKGFKFKKKKGKKRKK